MNKTFQLMIFERKQNDKFVFDVAHDFDNTTPEGILQVLKLFVREQEDKFYNEFKL